MPVEDWLPATARAAAVERKLKAGETLFRLGDKTVGLYEVVAGRVRLGRVDRSGHETVIYVAGAGETIAEASLFSPVYHCDAVASTEARVRLYPRSAVLAAMNDRKAAQAFTATLARQVMTLRTRLEQRNIRSARERVRHYLALNAGADGRTVALTRHAQGCLPPNWASPMRRFYRTLAALERAGEIKRTGEKLR